MSYSVSQQCFILLGFELYIHGLVCYRFLWDLFVWLHTNFLCFTDINSCGVKVQVWIAQLCLTFATPRTAAHQAPLLGILQARILECVAIPFSRGSSWPRDWIFVSHITGGFFTIRAIREAQLIHVATVDSFSWLHNIPLYSFCWWTRVISIFLFNLCSDTTM